MPNLDVDEPHQHDVPIDRRHSPSTSQASTPKDTRILISDNQVPNGCHSNEPSLKHQQQHQHTSSSTHHVPQHQHSQENQIQPASAFHSDRTIHHSMSTGTQVLDEAATAQTILLRQGGTNKPSLDGRVVTMEEADDDTFDHCERASNGASGYLHPQSLQPAPIKSDLFSMSKVDEAKENDSADQAEKTNLIQQLHTLRKQRHHVQQQIFPSLCENSNEWDFQLSSAQQSYQNALSTLEAVRAKRILADDEYQSSCKWHVLGDVFFVWYRGPFGTINGFRLGKSATTMVGLLKKCAGSDIAGGGLDAGKVAESGAGGGSASIFSWGSSEDNGTAASRSTQSSTNVNSSINNPATPKDPTLENIIVPWTEINSALGQVVFLLYTLQHAPYSGVSFGKHILQPCGSASKIGVLKKSSLSNPALESPSPHRNHRNERRRITALAAYHNNGTQPTSQSSIPAPLPGEVTWYNLHHYEEKGSLLSMGYYARRNFNAALEGLLYCIAEACFMVEKRDMALAAPYTMRVGGLVVGKDVHRTEGNLGACGGNKDRDMTVGGLPLAYDPAAGEQWTLVCKYLLTNLKWLVAYAAKHVDR